MSQRHRKPIGRRSPGEGRRTFWSSVAFVALLTALGVAHAWSRVAITERTYRLKDARDAHAELMHELQSLRIEVGTLQGAGRLDREAQVKLAMQRPSPDQMVVIDAGSGTRASAPAKDGVGLAVKLP